MTEPLQEHEKRFIIELQWKLREQFKPLGRAGWKRRHVEEAHRSARSAHPDWPLIEYHLGAKEAMRLRLLYTRAFEPGAALEKV